MPFQVRHELGRPLVGEEQPAAFDRDRLRPDLVDPLAHVVLASVNEVALLVAQSDDPEAAMLLSRLLG